MRRSDNKQPGLRLTIGVYTTDDVTYVLFDESSLDAFAARLDDTCVIAAYNGVFDLEVLANYFERSRVDAWKRKLIDPMKELCRLSYYNHNRYHFYVSMQALADKNGLGNKLVNEDRLGPVEQWARYRDEKLPEDERRRHRDALERYCAQDVKLLFAIYNYKQKLRVPVIKDGQEVEVVEADLRAQIDKLERCQWQRKRKR